MTKKQDDMLARIEAFNEANGGGVIVQKAAKRLLPVPGGQR